MHEAAHTIVLILPKTYMYGPPWASVRLGFMISDNITESAPYLPRNNFAHSIPSWPNPPTNGNKNCSIDNYFDLMEVSREKNQNINISK